MSEYLENAEDFYKKAMTEFEKGRKKGDETTIRDAAEKAWNAVVQSTNYLFEKKGLPVPKTHAERRKAIIDLGVADPEVKSKGLKDRFMARSVALREACFYEGIYDVRDLEEEMGKVGGYIEDVKGL